MELRGKIAVVTGAGNGIGRELAVACAREGADIVLAGVDERGMQATADLGGAAGRTALPVPCGAPRADAVEHLAARAWERFGAAQLLFNNAGVAVVGPSWTSTVDDWTWILGINVMGVVHGIRAFVPR